MFEPVLVDNIAVYNPEGDIRLEEAKKYAEILEGDYSRVISLKASALLISFKNIDNFEREPLLLLLDEFAKLAIKCKLEYGISDYSTALYKQLVEIYHDCKISLYKNRLLATFFFDINQVTKKNNVIVFNENYDMKMALTEELSKDGVQVVTPSNSLELEKYESKKNAATIIVKETLVDIATKYIDTEHNGDIVIYKLKNAISKNMALLFNQEEYKIKLKDGHRIFIFDCKNIYSIDIHAIDFFIELILGERKYKALFCFCNMREDIVDKDLKIRLRKGGAKLFASVENVLANKSVQAISKTAAAKRGSTLTKELVSKIPIVVNATVETFEMMTGGKTEKKGNNIGQLSVDDTQSCMGSIIGFDGDLDGTIAIIFAKDLAQEVMLGMLGEEVEDEEELVDSIGEFANIIAGRTKALLQEQKTNIKITIPKCFSHSQDILDIIKESQGVLINITLNEKPIYIFLTGKLKD
jgi:CheY-specific phosphatase CheX